MFSFGIEFVFVGACDLVSARVGERTTKCHHAKNAQLTQAASVQKAEVVGAVLGASLLLQRDPFGLQHLGEPVGVHGEGLRFSGDGVVEEGVGDLGVRGGRGGRDGGDAEPLRDAQARREARRPANKQPLQAVSVARAWCVSLGGCGLPLGTCFEFGSLVVVVVPIIKRKQQERGQGH